MPKLNFLEIIPKWNPCPNWFSIVFNCPGQISNLKLRNFREKVKFLQFKIHFKHLFDKLQLHWHANSNTLIKFWLITSKVMQVCRWVTRVHHARCSKTLKLSQNWQKLCCNTCNWYTLEFSGKIRFGKEKNKLLQ